MVNQRNKYKDLLVIVIGFCVIGIFLKLRFGKEYWNYMIYGALAIGVLGVMSETAATWITRGWEAFGKFLGKISSTILLSAMFILIVSPIAILKKITTKAKESGGTSWEAADETTVDFEKPW